MDRIRLLIIDDHPVVTRGLVTVLENEASIEVVGVAASVADGEEMAQATRPDVVLVDYKLPDGTGAQVAESIHASQPDVAVVFLTADTSLGNLMAAVDAGATGFLSKATGPEAIVDSVLRAAAGEMLIPAASLVEVMRARSAGARAQQEREREVAKFTRRELQVLRLMAEGLDSADTAERLNIGVSTVRWHVQSALGKLSAHSKLEAVARAVELGLLTRS